MSNEAVRIEPPKSYNEITWKDHGPLADLYEWAPQRKVTKWLMEEAEVTSVSNEEYATNIPRHFKCGSLKIRFLPHWGFYEIENLRFSLPETKEQLLSDLALVEGRLAQRAPLDTPLEVAGMA